MRTVFIRLNDFEELRSDMVSSYLLSKFDSWEVYGPLGCPELPGIMTKLLVANKLDEDIRVIVNGFPEQSAGILSTTARIFQRFMDTNYDRIKRIIYINSKPIKECDRETVAKWCCYTDINITSVITDPCETLSFIRKEYHEYVDIRVISLPLSYLRMPEGKQVTKFLFYLTNDLYDVSTFRKNHDVSTIYVGEQVMVDCEAFGEVAYIKPKNLAKYIDGDVLIDLSSDEYCAYLKQGLRWEHVIALNKGMKVFVSEGVMSCDLLRALGGRVCEFQSVKDFTSPWLVRNSKIDSVKMRPDIAREETKKLMQFLAV